MSWNNNVVLSNALSIIQVDLQRFSSKSWDTLCPFLTFMGHMKDSVTSRITLILRKT